MFFEKLTNAVKVAAKASVAQTQLNAAGKRLASVTRAAMREPAPIGEETYWQRWMDWCVWWHWAIRRRVIGRESDYSRENGSPTAVYGMSAFLGEMELAIAGARDVPIARAATDPNWQRVVTLSIHLASVEKVGEVSGEEIIAIYTHALKSLGLPRALGERPYDDFYASEGLDQAVEITLSTEDLDTLLSAVQHLALGRSRTEEEGFYLLPPATQRFAGDVALWRGCEEPLASWSGREPVTVELTPLKVDCMRGILDEHMSVLERRTRHEIPGNVTASELTPQECLDREQSMLERLRAAGAKDESTPKKPMTAEGGNVPGRSVNRVA